MIKVVKGNVVLRVPDEKLDYYVSRGFTAKTLEGEIIKEAVPNDITSLRKAYLQSLQKIKALEEKIETLTEDNKSLNRKAQLDRTQQPIVSEDKPKRTRRKSSDLSELSDEE